MTFSLIPYTMSPKHLLTFFLILGLFQSATAQNRSFGTLPLAKKPGASLSSGPGINDTPIAQKAMAVYDRLVQARGDFRYPPPAFTMSKAVGYVAYIDYGKMEITLEEKAAEVCASMGPEVEDAALAFLLGHELTHYYEKHAWREGFVAANKDLAIAMTLDSLADDTADETEADYLGGFLGYSAGYGLFDQGDKLIGKLYQAYGIPDLIPGYPSLADREALTHRSAEKLVGLVEVFEMANMLAALGRYKDAYEYYRYVLMQYQSRETYNNVGVTAVLDALQYFNPSELKFRLPLELDLESSAKGNDGMVNKREQILRQAILHFDAAISLDPNYAPAYLNKACAYALLNDTVRARFYAETETKQAALVGHFPKTSTDADILIGILDFRAGNATAAEAAFATAAGSGSALGAHNLRVLRNEPQPTEIPPSAGLRREKIDDKTIAAISADPQFVPSKDVSVGPNLMFRQNPAEGPGSKLFISQNLVNDEIVFLHLTNPAYQEPTARGISLGDDRATVVEKYGEPTTAVETPRGQIMVYKAILFILDNHGKVARWGNYLISS